MSWDALILGIIGIYVTFKTAKFADRFKSLKYLGYALSALFFTLGEFCILIDDLLNSYNLTIHSGDIIEWTTIISISFLLSGLAVLIRESKPVFAQFPLVYAALPLLLVISYWLVKDTLAIKEWLMSIYQGGALMVALLMYGVHSYRAGHFTYILGTTLLFLVTFIVYWFIPGVENNFVWIWESLLGISVASAGFSLEYHIRVLDSAS